jgi:membrane associated rhomboid family serine protease
MPSGRDIFAPKLGLTLPLCGLHFVFYFLMTSDPQKVVGLFGFHPSAALAQPWTFLTYQFLTNGPINLFFGTMMLYILGGALESEWGTGEFTVFWLVATLGCSGTAWLIGLPLYSGAAVVNVSMLFTYAYLSPDAIFFLLVLPVKAKWMAWLTAGWLGWTVISGFGRAGLAGGIAALVQVVGMAAGFLFYWVRHQGRSRARRVSREVVSALKTAGSLRQDEALEKRNRELFPRVEALRAEARSGAPVSGTGAALEGELKRLVVAGVKICKPVDFKGDKDGICVKCEGFAECSLRYVAGEPSEIVVRNRQGD